MAEPVKTFTNGPTLEQYVETRLNLLIVYIDKAEQTVLERVEALDKASVARYGAVREEVQHARELLQLAQDNSKRAVDKAEAAQHAHNVASNEWRGTLNDFKATLVGKSEFDRLSNDFSAYRLEVSRLLASFSAEKVATKEVKEAGMGVLGMVGTAAGAVAAIVVSISIAVLRPSAPQQIPQLPQQAPQVVVVPAPAAPATQPQLTPR